MATGDDCVVVHWLQPAKTFNVVSCTMAALAAQQVKHLYASKAISMMRDWLMVSLSLLGPLQMVLNTR